jgi:DNA-directed RNA polymerase specialized sigma24 family protein
VEPVDTRAHPEDEIAGWEREEIVREVLAGLSPKDRNVLGLVYIDEVDRLEACKRLNIGSGYLRVVLFRARSEFRRILERRKRIRSV